jgi:hypothetical protein
LLASPLIRSNPGSFFGSHFWVASALSPAFFPHPRLSDGTRFSTRAAQPCPLRQPKLTADPYQDPSPERPHPETALPKTASSERPLPSDPPPRRCQRSDPLLAETRLGEWCVPPSDAQGGFGMTLEEAGTAPILGASGVSGGPHKSDFLQCLRSIVPWLWYGIVSASCRWCTGEATWWVSKAGPEEGSGCSRDGGTFLRRRLSGWPPCIVFVTVWTHSVGDARACAVPVPWNVHLQGLNVVTGKGCGCGPRYHFHRLREGSRDPKEEGHEAGGAHTLG